MMLEFEWQSVGALVAAATAGATIAGAAMRGWMVNKYADVAAVSALEEQVAAHASQLVVLGEAVKHLPTIAQVHSIEMGLAGLQGGLASISRQLDTLDRRFALVDEHLREPPK